jgi:hypothetical protein
LGPTEAVTAEVQLDIGHHQMLVASKAEISKLRIIKHEGSITAATVAVANQMTIYFPSDKIHRTRSWITQLLNAIENHSQRKSIYRSRRRAADGEQSVGWHQSLSHSE